MQIVETTLAVHAVSACMCHCQVGIMQYLEYKFGYYIA